ncbi:RNA-guided endonuclease InsQ/TnpB family protein [Armatimonas rosea]|uniref:Putative transposase n=1 Tax=Armatimonas rosea TaxID=685828 RepID=A0A7W9W4L8_ARMRO|nr:putative transposase [Armatimonas rosea]
MPTALDAGGIASSLPKASGRRWKILDYFPFHSFRFCGHKHSIATVASKAYKYRIYPTKNQLSIMLQLLETHRHLYNNALAQRKEWHEAEKTPLNFAQQCKILTQERKINPFLAFANAASCQRTLKRLDRSFQAFFRRVKSGEAPGYPRFKGRGQFDSVEYTIGDGCKFTLDNKAYFQKVGNIKIKMHRPIEGKIKTMRFKKEGDGWHVVFSCELPPMRSAGHELPDVEIEATKLPSVGIDLGLKSFLVDSEGNEVKPPKHYRKAQAKLRRLQRSVARKKRGGANRKKSVNRLAKFSQHVANQRKDFHHKSALDLVKRFGKIAHENLNVKGIVRSLNLAKSAHDAGWGKFLSILKHKAESAGVEVVGVDPQNTTQACSNCGCLPVEKLTLKVRVYKCLHCGLILDRDHNAAINIRNKAWIEPLGVNQEGYLMDFSRSPQL